MSESESPSAEQQSYWLEMTQLKVDACYVRDYRNAMGRWLTWTAGVRALTSSVSIGAWAVWRQYAYVWAVLIAMSQVADALGPVFPFRKRHQALSRWATSLNRMFVFAQRDWDDIACGRVTDAKIRRLTHQIRLRKQRHEAKYVPNGLPLRQEIYDRAEDEVDRFFKARYSSVEDERLYEDRIA